MVTTNINCLLMHEIANSNKTLLCRNHYLDGHNGKVHIICHIPNPNQHRSITIIRSSQTRQSLQFVLTARDIFIECIINNNNNNNMQIYIHINSPHLVCSFMYTTHKDCHMLAVVYWHIQGDFVSPIRSMVYYMDKESLAQNLRCTTAAMRPDPFDQHLSLL